MEQKNQTSNEDIEETLGNILVNQDDNKIDISQNDIKLTANVIKKENEKQDSEEHLHEKFDNILETFDSENDDMAVKVEESENYPLYSEKYFDDFVATLDEKKINIGDNDIEEFLAEDDEISLKDHDKNKSDNVKVEENNDYPLYYDYPSANLDEIKIDIVDNDIESMNNEINIQYKSEDIEEFSTGDIDLPWEDENKTDKEVKFFHKILKVKQKDAALSKNIKQKKSDIVDRKDKIIKKHKCSICKKNFSKSSHLNRHMRIHTGEKPNECDICQKKFIYPSALKQHLEIHSRVKPHECSACQKKFSYLSQLRMHTIIHTGEKPHACDVCQKKFNRLSNLMSHKRIHTGEKSHKCDVCQKKFSRLADVIRHMRIHTGEKPHKCDVCKKKFNHPSHLRKHTIIHTREKLYECDVCQKKFTHSSSLRIHMRIHTGDKLHECDVCQKKFIWSSSLKNHMKMHDGERI